ncbi:NYN domain-containing protein [Aliterella atlantica]|uniref:RNA-binding protein containing a PIN domain protein n=1 Tax=Aliterella atlantica CENA595 TaxID=1618023 RepID=A0A0D8ZLS6_9CYAN|nr:NYN domain-containing protein [Aliterella atlantica]KJH69389.1 RNA-binding protein containing a PIN domain protein [Aliterella atlantica CENA595]
MPRFLPEAVLLVDGYNAIGSWSDLKKTRDCVGLEAARWELVEALVNYSALQNYATQVVFDAQYQNSCSHQEVISEHLSVHFTDFGQTADTYIEKSCASLRPYMRQSHLCRLIVATSDRVQQLVVVGYGAEWMSAQQLNYEVEATLKKSRYKHKQRKQSSSRFLANSIDAKARQKLAQMRMGL